MALVSDHIGIVLYSTIAQSSSSFIDSHLNFTSITSLNIIYYLPYIISVLHFISKALVIIGCFKCLYWYVACVLMSVSCCGGCVCLYIGLWIFYCLLCLNFLLIMILCFQNSAYFGSSPILTKLYTLYHTYMMIKTQKQKNRCQ